mmetsp:Transcript_20249/g.51747  ORF Transcript_20249/g.51747 Transcript_20249/m.51747 type:complete len:490 (-) Transcript_20249:434-1903(-)
MRTSLLWAVIAFFSCVFQQETGAVSRFYGMHDRGFVKNRSIPADFAREISTEQAWHPPRRQLDTEHTPHRLAFGSCNQQKKPQLLWDDIARLQPSAFFWMGDMIYSDTRNMKVLRRDYEQQLRRRRFREFLSEVPVKGVWDDHDFGENDAGSNYPYREESKQVYFDFFDEDEATRQEMKGRGLYRSYTFEGHEGSVKVIMLDTRYHRDYLFVDNLLPAIAWLNGKIPFVGALTRVIASLFRAFVSTFSMQYDFGSILGEKQWAWLENEMKGDDADVYIIVSSVQVLTEMPVVEGWHHFPQERERLLKLIQATHPQQTVMVSGDVHYGEMLRVPCNNEKGEVEFYLPELTTSGMTHSCESQMRYLCKWNIGLAHTNRVNIDSVYPLFNFGTIDLQWGEKEVGVTLNLKGVGGGTQLSQSVTVPRRGQESTIAQCKFEPDLGVKGSFYVVFFCCGVGVVLLLLLVVLLLRSLVRRGLRWWRARRERQKKNE